MSIHSRAVVLAAIGLLASCSTSREVSPTGAKARIEELRTRFGAPILNARAQVSRRAIEVTLPSTADGESRLHDVTSRVSVRFKMLGTTASSAETADGYMVYPRALDGADLLHRTDPDGIEDFVVFESRPAKEEIRYAVDVSRVSGLRLVANTLEFLDATGSPSLRVAPPYLVDAGGERTDARLEVEGCAYDDDPRAPWGRPTTSPGVDSCTVHVHWHAAAYPALLDPAWSTTGSIAAARQGLTASPLPGGRALVAGGNDSGGSYGSAEIFDPAANGGVGAFAATGSMVRKRSGHTTTVLAAGKVLVVGGIDFASGVKTLVDAEIYDPATGKFTATGSLTDSRWFHTATMLASGKVLIGAGLQDGFKALGTAEIFDPAGNGGLGAFSTTGALAAARGIHTASLLPSGKVLFAGGFAQGLGLASAEIFDAAANNGVGAFSATGPLASARSNHTANALPSGKILVAGGGDSSNALIAGAELFDPAANGGVGAFVPTGSLVGKRAAHVAVPLSGKILLVGGQDATKASLASAELFDPVANGGLGAFAATGSLVTARVSFAAVPLPSGRVLVVGGHTGDESSGTPTASAELSAATLGEACVGTESCQAPNVCVDGVCCDTACDKACDRCNLPGKEGTCTIAPLGTASASCDAFACNGVIATCPTSCASDDACAATHYCAPDGACKTRKPRAAACNTQSNCKTPGCRECESGHCADGFCCDSACDGTCEACAARLKQSGSADGTCGPSKDGTDPHEQCEPSGVTCGADGACNGTGACRLVTPAGSRCGASACQANAAQGQLCDGAGACSAATIECAPGRCAAGACVTTCTGNEECAADARCNNGTCEKRGTNATCDGDHTTTGVDGTAQDCAPYKCEPNGTCRSECISVTDCVDPFVCDTTGKCTVPATRPSSSEADGCSISLRGGSSSLCGVWLVAIALVMARRRAR